MVCMSFGAKSAFALKKMTNQKIVKMKIALLNLAKQLDNVSRACQLMGYSRDSYYRLKKLYEAGGEAALEEKPRQKSNLKNRVPREIENRVLEVTLQQPALGQGRIAKELRRQGVMISPAGVRCIWVRHRLETMQKRIERSRTTDGEEGIAPSPECIE